MDNKTALDIVREQQATMTEVPESSATLADYVVELRRLHAAVEREAEERNQPVVLSEWEELQAELAALRELLTAYNLGGWTDAKRLLDERKAVEARAERLEAEVAALRGTLMELRIRLHAAGRRPEECYEMSMIDDALREGK